MKSIGFYTIQQEVIIQIRNLVIFKKNPTPSPQKAVEEKCSVLTLELHAFLRQYQCNVMLPAQ